MQSLFITFTIILVLSCSCNAQGSDYTEFFKKVILAFQKNMKSGNETLDIPQLDPTQLSKDIEIDISGKLSLKASIFGALVNLSNFEVNDLVADSDLNINTTLTFYNLLFDGGYSVVGNAMSVVPIKGSGPAKFGYERFRISVMIRPTIFPFGIEKLDLIYDLDDLVFIVDGFLGEVTDPLPELISSFLSDLVPKIATDLHLQISHFIENEAVILANEFLAGKDVGAILQYLKKLVNSLS